MSTRLRLLRKKFIDLPILHHDENQVENWTRFQTLSIYFARQDYSNPIFLPVIELRGFVWVR